MVLDRQKIIIAIITTLVVAVAFIFNPFRAVKFTTSDTPFPNENKSVTMDGDIIRYYDGSSFYKLDIKNGEVSVLSSPVKLPTVKEVLSFTDNGIVATFDNSLENSPIQEYSEVHNLSYADQSGAIWYYDFESEEISQITKEEPLYIGNPAQSKNIVFVSSDGDVRSIKLIDTDSKKITQTVPLVSEAGAATYVGECLSSNTPCISYRDQVTNEGILSSIVDGSLKEIYKAKDSAIIPVHGTDRIIVLDGDTDPEFTNYTSVALIDTETGKTIKSYNETYTSPLISYSSDDDSLILSSDDRSHYRDIKKLGPFQLASKGTLSTSGDLPKDIAAIATDNVSFGKNTLSMSSTGRYVISSRQVIELDIRQDTDVMDYIYNCVGDRGRIMELDGSSLDVILKTSSFSDDFNNIGTCLLKDPGITQSKILNFKS